MGHSKRKAFWKLGTGPNFPIWEIGYRSAKKMGPDLNFLNEEIGTRSKFLKKRNLRQILNLKYKEK